MAPYSCFRKLPATKERLKRHDIGLGRRCRGVQCHCAAPALKRSDGATVRGFDISELRAKLTARTQVRERLRDEKNGFLTQWRLQHRLDLPCQAGALVDNQHDVRGLDGQIVDPDLPITVLDIDACCAERTDALSGPAERHDRTKAREFLDQDMIQAPATIAGIDAPAAASPGHP